MTRRVRRCLALLLAWQLGAVFRRAFTALQGDANRPQRLSCWADGESGAAGAEGGHTDPRIITNCVTNAASAADILAIMQLEQENPKLNLISVSAAWCRLAKLQGSINSQVTKSESFLLFVKLTHSLLETPAGHARQVANILWATARLPGSAFSQLTTLWTSLSRAANATASEMNAQQTANSIWAVATLSTTNTNSEVFSSMLPALANRVPVVISDMNAQNVASVIWAAGQLLVNPSHAIMSHDLRELLPVLTVRARGLLPSAKPQALANSCWGLALSDHHDEAFFLAVADRVVKEAAVWKPAGAELDLPSVLCAFARLTALGRADMLGVAAKKLTPMLRKINNWGLCATLWSYQQLDRGDDFLTFRQCMESEVARRRLSNDVERSRLGPEAWPAGQTARQTRQGQSTAGNHTDPRIITNCVRNATSAAEVLAIMQRQQENPELSLISVSAAWCRLAKLQGSLNSKAIRSQSFYLFVGLTTSLLEQPAVRAREVANILWATAKLQRHASSQITSLWTRLARAVKTSAGAMNAQQNANSIWAVATLATAKVHFQGLPSALRALAKRVPAVIADMNARDASSVIWAMAKLVTVDPETKALCGLLPALASRVPAVISDMRSQAVASVLWAVAKLAAADVEPQALLDLLRSSAGRIPDVVSEMKAQEVSNVIWAAGQLAVMSDDLRAVLPVVVDRASVALPSATPQNLGNSVWGLALSNYSDEAFLEAVADKVANEAAGWTPRLAERSLPAVLCAVARLKAEFTCDKLLEAVAAKLSPIIDSINDWGLCALTWSYQKLDVCDDCLIFHQDLAMQVAMRNFSQEDVERSSLGPETWYSKQS
ncbi:unnamed protein product [Effrenium voratum]|uniref:Uncharacterized protein n=1 Tax=Effrenium voratum TaxID=2562239 RepID=A0AA36N7Q9_9DINO|nr:unnamed protein product [Effrenium voratum]CAJ1425586.1 unnamed protein product [Effrenium voratum]